MLFRKISLLIALALSLIASSALAQTAFDADIDAACATYGCDPEGLKRVALCESWGMHTDRYGNYITGPNGEIGLFQFHPAGTWGPVGNVYTQIDIAAQEFAAGRGEANWVCAWAYYG